MAIPKSMQAKYDAIAAIIEPYCDQYLSDEYKTICLYALEKLCRKRPSPLKSGRDKTWAAGIIYAIGSTNFIFDKDQPIHMTAEQLVAPLSVAKNTAAGKAAEIKKMLNISYFAPDWTLSSITKDHPYAWMILH